jgi:hypothetical protein
MELVSYKECPRYDIKLLVGDMNAQVERDATCKHNTGRHGLHDDKKIMDHV